MPISFVGAGTVAAGTGAITVGLPSGLLAGDLLFLLVETANQAVTTPSGWTIAPSSPQGVGTAAGTAATRLSMFYRWVDGTQTSASVADSGDHQIAGMVAYRGVDPASPFNASAGSVKSTASTTATFPNVTTTKDGCWVLLAEAHALPDSTSTAIAGTRSGSNLTDLTERLDNNTNAGNGGGFSLADGLKATAGSVTGGTVALTTSSVGAHITLALAPQPQAYLLDTEPGALDLAGLDADLALVQPLNNYALDTVPGSLALGGVSAALAKDQALAVTPGELALTGQPATTTKRLSLAAQPGVLALAGSPATLQATRHLATQTGSLALSGNAADLTARADKLLQTEPGAYALSGLSAETALTVPAAYERWDEGVWDDGYWDEFRLRTLTGELVLAGQAATLVRRLELRTTPGALSLTGAAARTLRGTLAQAQTGQLALTGATATAQVLRLQLVQPAAFAVTGVAANTLLARVAQTTPGAYLAGGLAAATLKASLLRTEVGGVALTGGVAYVQDGYVAPGYVDALGAAMRAERLLSTTPSALGMTGQSAAMRTVRQVATVAGVFGLTGQAASVVRMTRLVTQPGVLQVTGVAAGLAIGKLIVTQPGQIVLAGQEATLRAAMNLRTTPGAWTTTGVAAELLKVAGGTLAVTPGAMNLGGLPASLLYSGDAGVGDSLVLMRRRRRM